MVEACEVGERESIKVRKNSCLVRIPGVTLYCPHWCLDSSIFSPHLSANALLSLTSAGKASVRTKQLQVQVLMEWTNCLECLTSAYWDWQVVELQHSWEPSLSFYFSLLKKANQNCAGQFPPENWRGWDWWSGRVFSTLWPCDSATPVHDYSTGGLVCSHSAGTN